MSGPPLIPPGPGVPDALKSILNSYFDAITALRNPGAPVQLAHVDTKANLTGRYPADNYRGGVVICDEINSIVHSTLLTSVWTWLRADGGSL